jgi:hypothetical protein
MKKNIIIVFCLLSLSFTAFAQNNPTANDQLQAQRAASLQQVTAAAKEVGADEKQLIKLKAILENLYKKQDEIKADTSLAAPAKQEKLKAANADKDWRVQNLLGDKYKAYGEVRKRLITEAAAKKP